MTPKQLLLLRHAKSDWDSGARGDFERPLSERGRRDAPRMGRYLAENGYIPGVIIASPSARTTETTGLVCAAWKSEAPAQTQGDNATGRVQYDRRLYHGAAARIREIATAQLEKHDRVMIVGHNPGMEAALLAYCPSAAPFADGKLMPTCALAVIELAGGDAGGTLRVLMRPSMLSGL